MMSSGRLGPELRAAVRKTIRFSRHPAFSITSHERSGIRLAWSLMEKLYGACLNDVRVLPISSIEWSSEIRTVNGLPIIVLDVEQINALSFGLNRTYRHEHPIFHYSEYLTRAGELLVSNGELGLATKIAEINRKQLIEFSKHHGAHPLIPRRIDTNGLKRISRLLHASIPLSFVLGHEIGHAMLVRGGFAESNLEEIDRIWRDKCFIEDPETKKEGGPAAFSRFIGQNYSTRLDESGLPIAFASRGTHLVTVLPQLIKGHIEESQCDFSGLLLCSAAAMQAGIGAPELFSALMHMIVQLDRQMLLRSAVTQVPRERRRAVVCLGQSKTRSRGFMLIQMIDALKNGRLAVPTQIRDYWQNFSDANWKFVIDGAEKSALHCAMGEIFARGGIYLGVGGTSMKREEIEEIEEMKIKSLEDWMLKNHLLAQAMPFSIVPDGFYDIRSSFDWTGEDGPEPNAIAFGSAVRDLAREVIDGVRCNDENSVDSVEKVLDAVRRPRILIQAGQVNE